jgi:hypothetical protein
MAIGVYVNPPAMTTASYDQINSDLEEAGEGRPAGRTFHCAFGPADKLMIFDIWDSPQAFEEFGKVLMPIVAKAGVEIGEPAIMEIHNMTF